MKNKIAILTTSRSDYSLISPLLLELRKTKKLIFKLIVCGSHLSQKHGLTINEIYKDKNKIDFKFNSFLKNNENIDKSIELMIKGFNKALAKLKPNLIFLPGDRYEILAAAYSAYLHKIPIIHYAGGQITEGAWDDAIRHSITKLSSLHYVSTKNCRKILIQMGENPHKVFVTGSLGIDNTKNLKLYFLDEIENMISFKLKSSFALVTFHQETLSNVKKMNQIKALINALKYFKNISYIFTAPNIDENSNLIINEIKKFIKQNKNSVFIPSLGKKLFLSILKKSKFMIGNSSSGIIEAPNFKVPTINIGDRQKGRILSKSIINCKNNKQDIIKSIKKAISSNFKKKIRNVKSPYGNGHAAKNIVTLLNKININKIERKKFYFNV